MIGAVPAIIGTVEPNTVGFAAGRSSIPPRFAIRGKVAPTARKCLLPTYDVFDEDRYFEPATSARSSSIMPGYRIGITICEDIWTHPMISTRRLYRGRIRSSQLARQKCDLMVNLSASPWHSNKAIVRQKPWSSRFGARAALPGRVRQLRRRKRRIDFRRPQPCV